MILDQQRLTSLRGIGPERAGLLARLDLHTVEDLLLHRPRRYEDRRRLVAIRDLKLKEAAAVRGRVVAAGIKRWRKGTKALFECILEDGTARVHLRWWQAQPWMEDHFAVGREFLAFGKVESLKPRTVDHPETELVEAGEENFIHLNRIVPVYPLTEGLPQRWLRALIWRTLEQFGSRIVELHPEIAVPDLPARAQALRMLHFPDEFTEAAQARRRLALDEFLEMQLAIQRRRQRLYERATGLPCAGDNRLIRPFLKRLGYALTAAQMRVLREIRHDLGSGRPMRRLLQGDVGSGKTVVAACTALMALESGCSVALMAPTEVLAGQHEATFRGWFEPLGVPVELWTGNRKTRDTDRGARGTPDAPSLAPRASLFVGTHALIEAGFAPERLGLVIIDEQHKFGVAQREKLVRKGRYPHLLVMTATPIPRTLGLTLYGDLDLSVIDEMPAGRGRVKTHLRGAEALPKVWEFVRAQLARGRQAYVVYPRVEEGTGEGLKSVVRACELLRHELAPYPVGLLHGRLNPAEKDAVMREFASGRIKALVATTVIEVGVDVPNATVMVIENAAQHGLAQLHQLRGRIGRGAHEAHCILVADHLNAEARERLQTLVRTTDGFEIAEADLRLRGPGELLGQAQSGLPALRFGDLAGDRDLVERARVLAREAVGGQ
jgi:ATP-dependent DNA helicase RecG